MYYGSCEYTYLSIFVQLYLYVCRWQLQLPIDRIELLFFWTVDRKQVFFLLQIFSLLFALFPRQIDNFFWKTTRLFERPPAFNGIFLVMLLYVWNCCCCCRCNVSFIINYEWVLLLWLRGLRSNYLRPLSRNA